MGRRNALVVAVCAVLALPAQGLGAGFSVFNEAREESGFVSMKLFSVPGAVITWETRDGTATAPADYATSGGTVTFGPGETEKEIIVPIVDDTETEPLEVFVTLITAVTGDVLDPVSPSGSARIIDNDAGPCSNLITGTAGPDTLQGAFGSNRILGLGGNDSLRGSFGNDCINGGDGDDRILGLDGKDILLGGAGRDQLAGGIGDDDVRGERGNDTVNGLDGNDRVQGGPGNDNVAGGDGSDQVFGGSGDDVILGEGGGLSLFPGNDRLVGGPGRDRFFGGVGQDRIEARDGTADTIDCGGGRDVAVVDRLDRVRGCERVLRG